MIGLPAAGAGAGAGVATQETRWWLVRHAPVPDPEGRILGQLDHAADTGDTETLEDLARTLPAQGVALTTPLTRTGQTARALVAAGLRLPRPEPVAALMEQHFGAWQGRTWGALLDADPPDPAVAAFWADPASAAPPGGESFAAVRVRVAEALDALSTRHAGRDIIAVVHAGTVRAALAHALDLSPAAALRVAVAPLSLTRLDRLDGVGADGPCWRVVCVNAEPLPRP